MKHVLLAALLATALPQSAQDVPTGHDHPAPSELLPNGREPEPGLLTGGQISAQQLLRLRDAGATTFINLRTEGEPGELPASIFEEHGLRHVRIPVAGADGINERNAAALEAALAAAEGSHTVVYCGSGNRVGALLALSAHRQGKAPEEALAFGLEAGLTGLEKATREKLGLAPE